MLLSFLSPTCSRFLSAPVARNGSLQRTAPVLALGPGVTKLSGHNKEYVSRPPNFWEPGSSSMRVVLATRLAKADEKETLLLVDSAGVCQAPLLGV